MKLQAEKCLLLRLALDYSTGNLNFESIKENITAMLEFLSSSHHLLLSFPKLGNRVLRFCDHAVLYRMGGLASRWGAWGEVILCLKSTLWQFDRVEPTCTRDQRPESLHAYTVYIVALQVMKLYVQTSSRKKLTTADSCYWIENEASMQSKSPHKNKKKRQKATTNHLSLPAQERLKNTLFRAH